MKDCSRNLRFRTPDPTSNLINSFKQIWANSAMFSEDVSDGCSQIVERYKGCNFFCSWVNLSIPLGKRTLPTKLGLIKRKKIIS